MKGLRAMHVVMVVTCAAVFFDATPWVVLPLFALWTWLLWRGRYAT